MNSTKTTNNTNADNNNNNLNNMMTEAAIKEKYLRANNMKLLLAKLATVLMIITALLLSRSGSVIQKKDFSKTVYDDAKILSLDDTIKVIETRNAALYELKDAKIVVVVEKDRSGYNDLKKKADKLFKQYKAGDNGMLFIVSAHKSSGWGDSVGDFFDDLFGGGTQPYAYSTGRNLGDLAENKIESIFKDCFINNYEEKKYNAAILETFNALADYFDQYYDINSKNPDISEIIDSYNASSQSSSYVSIAGVIAIFVLLFILLGSLTRKKNPAASKVYKNPFWFN